MIKCADCPSWDKDEGCTATPSEIGDAVCLLRHIAITLNALAVSIENQLEDGEDWKYPSD